ncbi:MAG: ABC transporter permease [Proteobacteria bacterium]|nr:ABC transporter permease [Pseudomonadota bacterium]MBU4469817.1 ABC transporter permease [Pseudomonadota bacterium]MCG2753052.1 ABC transporter permease [Desulfobacteraceae bacterium]
MMKNYGQRYTFAMLFWLTVFFVFPFLIILVGSFLKKGLYGGFEFEFSLAAYTSLFSGTMKKVTLNTLFVSVATTVLTVAMAIPSAYYIARSPHKEKLLFLVIIPFWTNFLIRIFAWIAILGNNGLVNSFLISLGVFNAPVQLLYNRWAIILIMIYTSLPFAILPLYAIIEKFDFSLLEAARDLGATKWQSVYKILIPLIIPGITTAVLFTFIPAFGNFAIPDIVGGNDIRMLGNIINEKLKTARNWPAASSISMVLTLISVFMVLMFNRITASRDSQQKTET